MPKKNFYAVVRGNPPAPGIFTTWCVMVLKVLAEKIVLTSTLCRDQVKPMVTSFKGSDFKGFSTKEEAEAYMREKQMTYNINGTRPESEGTVG